jgi:benzoyl-CoA reductase/2-hydroxyglutaryl-CoA dehydratase subunit BcrC/BadD/HgdB
MKTVVYTCPYVPAEWIAAHGLRPRRLVPEPRTDRGLIARTEGLCPYARAFIHDAAADDGQADAIIVSTLCDQMRRVFDVLVREVDTPAFLLNVPSTWQTVAAQRMYIDEFHRLGRFLVGLGGRHPSNEELAHAMSAACQAHADARQRNEVDTPPASRIPIAIVGGPLMRRDRVLFELIASSGGWVVLDATETGARGQHRPFDRRALADDPLAELARAYFEIPDASRRPNSELYRWLQRELARSGARGIIVHHYLWCDTWRAEVGRLKEWSKLPVLQLDSDGCGETTVARSKNHIRAFLEMLQ